MSKPTILLVGLLSGAAASAFGQTDPAARPEAFAAATQQVEQDLAASLRELEALRARIAEERVPLSRALAEREAEVQQLRAQLQQQNRTLETRVLDLSNARNEMKATQETNTYIANLLADYMRSFESRLHVAELQVHKDVLAAAKWAAERQDLPTDELYKAKLAVVGESIARLDKAIGGHRFTGHAVDPTGAVKEGTYLMIGPAVVFSAGDSSVVGTAEQRLGSLDPVVVPFENPLDKAAADSVATTGGGYLPIDPTLGNALKVQATKESLIAHVLKGGPVMWPIFAIAFVALVVALSKWLQLATVRNPARRSIEALLVAVGRGERPAAEAAADTIPGPAGEMLRAGVQHLGEPKELIEEAMHETVLATKLRLNKWLSFIAITSSSAPLLGLLGTVTGIMNTFALMTVFGSSDVKQLSSGISEALITTEYGLYVAIPSLLLYAILSRKARGILDRMDQAGVAFVNQVGRTEELWRNQRKRRDAAATGAESGDRAADGAIALGFS
jgi:biopolymer transport protein ExbB